MKNTILEDNVRPTQCNRVDWYIREYGSITQLEALRDLGVMRLASRISAMKKDGMDIKDRWVEVKNRFGEVCHVKQYYYEDEVAQ